MHGLKNWKSKERQKESNENSTKFIEVSVPLTCSLFHVSNHRPSGYQYGMFPYSFMGQAFALLPVVMLSGNTEHFRNASEEVGL